RGAARSRDLRLRNPASGASARRESPPRQPAAVGRPGAGGRSRRGRDRRAPRRCPPAVPFDESRMSAFEAEGLGKCYGSAWALRACTLAVPEGSVTALVGPNGAGKTTLLHLAVGLARPSAGELRVLGRDPRHDAATFLPGVGFVAQDHPLVSGFSVGDTLEL